MKIILTILALSVAMTACSPAEVDFDTLQDRNGVKYEPNSEAGFTGRAVSFYENGQKKQEWNYKDGELDGLQTTWYENGQKDTEWNFKDGEQDGLTTKWYENGQKKAELNWKNGELDGLQTTWYENGQKRLEWN